MGTKKFRFFIVVFVLALLGTMLFAHKRSLAELKVQSVKLEKLYKTGEEASNLSFALEHYRSQNSAFRKLDQPQIDAVKSELRKSFNMGLSALGSLDTPGSTLQYREAIQEKLTNLIAQSTEIEKTSYSKDAYQKESIRDLHSEIASNINLIKKDAQNKIAEVGSKEENSDLRTMQLFYACGLAIVGLVLSLLIENYFVFLRPLRKLHDYAAQVRQGNQSIAQSPSLPGVYGDIQVALSKLSENVESHLKERHKFILDVVSDLRRPLHMLQAGRRLLMGGASSQTGAPSATDEQQSIAAAHSMKHGIAILSGSLEDLNDIVEINRLETRLNEKIVDLTEVISDAARMLGSSPGTHSVKTSLPPMPVWVKIDRGRFERMLIQIVSKVTSTLATSSAGVQISLVETQAKNGRGIEIQIFDSSRLRKGNLSQISTGPDVDILKHWISDNGLSMALAYKVVRAHNGSISASGVNGTGVQVTIKLPAERLAGNGLIMAPEGLRTSAEEKPIALLGEDFVNIE
jgi:hypothetical protein